MGIKSAFEFHNYRSVQVIVYIDVNCFPSLIVHWILNFVDQSTNENYENWYLTNKSDFTVFYYLPLLFGSLETSVDIPISRYLTVNQSADLDNLFIRLLHSSLSLTNKRLYFSLFSRSEIRRFILHVQSNLPMWLPLLSSHMY